jgi:hypothetical protein
VGENQFAERVSLEAGNLVNGKKCSTFGNFRVPWFAEGGIQSSGFENGEWSSFRGAYLFSDEC